MGKTNLEETIFLSVVEYLFFSYLYLEIAFKKARSFIVAVLINVTIVFAYDVKYWRYIILCFSAKGRTIIHINDLNAFQRLI